MCAPPAAPLTGFLLSGAAPSGKRRGDKAAAGKGAGRRGPRKMLFPLKAPYLVRYASKRVAAYLNEKIEFQSFKNSGSRARNGEGAWGDKQAGCFSAENAVVS